MLWGTPWRKLRMVVSAEKVPFLLPALLAFVAWGLTHISDRLLNSPTLEYQCSLTGKAVGAWSCLVRNLSDERLFRLLHITLRIPDSVDKNVKVEEAAEIEWLGTAHHAKMAFPAIKEERNVEYVVPRLNPGQEVALKVRISGSSPRLEFHFWSDKDETQAVKALESGVFTAAVRHEQEIVASLIGLALLLAVLCVGMMKTEEEQTGPTETASFSRKPEGGEKVRRPSDSSLVKPEEEKPDQPA